MYIAVQDSADSLKIANTSVQNKNRRDFCNSWNEHVKIMIEMIKNTVQVLTLVFFLPTSTVYTRDISSNNIANLEKCD